MRRRHLILTLLTLSLTTLYASPMLSVATEKMRVAYPDGYRFWTHVKSMVIQQGHPLYDSFGGIHHIYANAKALQALQAGTPFPDGAVFVFDLLEVREENHALVEGIRKVVGVMHKDRNRFAETGGWGFEAFRGDTREGIVSDPKKACFACHASQQQQDYVFSRFRK